MRASDSFRARRSRSKINQPQFKERLARLTDRTEAIELRRHNSSLDSRLGRDSPLRPTEQLPAENSPISEATAIQSNSTSFYFSLQATTTLSGETFQDEDIIFYDEASQSFSTYFDGSDLGLADLEIDAFDIIGEDEILLSFNTAATIDGLEIDDSDLVLFTASQLGGTTQGSFELFFDGSDVGLTTNGEDIDGIQLLEDGSILISTSGSVRVPGLTGVKDEDILRFDPTSTGSNTAGTFSVYLDGSDIGLSTSKSEDVAALTLDDDGNLYLSTVGAFSVPEVVGNDEDVFVFLPTSTGDDTSGSFESNLFFDGGNLGIKGDIRGLDLAIGFGASDPVDPPPPPVEPEFDIEINFLDDSLNSSQQNVFIDAAARWEGIIIEDIPDVFVTDIGLVDDVVIDVGAPEIDGVGGILGQAGPTAIRSDSFLPATGIMNFDMADVDDLEANGLLEDVILHEMGHVLGIGTLWGLNDFVIGAGTNDPQYVGSQATAEYNDLFGLNGSSIPVANTGGSGTRDAHWRESVFDNELMTGYIDAGDNPISRVTVASLADLGYEVNLAAADSYSAPAQSLGGQLTASVAGETLTGLSSPMEDPSLGGSMTAEMLPAPDFIFV